MTIQILNGKNIIRPDGSTVFLVDLIASDVLDSYDIDGEDVGLGEGAILAAGSTIKYPGGSATLFEDDGTFTDDAPQVDDADATA